MTKLLRKDVTIATAEIGDAISEVLVTDTVVWFVVGKTAKSLKLVRGVRTGSSVAHHIDGNDYPVVYEGVAVPADFTKAQVRTVFEGKRGIRLNSWSRPHFTHVVKFDDGTEGPAVRTDWRY